MNTRKAILTFLSLMAGVFSLSAQVLDPVHWKFTAKKTGDNIYEVYATATLDDPWHIYSQYTDEGGPVPTILTFEDNPDVVLKGKPDEEGSLIEKYEDVFMVDTRYYAEQVSFVQKLEKQGMGTATLKGSVTFMACTDEQCLVPQEVEFVVALE
ncbi:protein-disulfide reductase DsbD domain-containing protein [Sinomicrobium soli]|uniref:protein-disulfide reductase DsbD domain-containing protein n=1 Tax=Sinomicrobium sp. N-1-3-6 TaxID=2219864 RepID=UPI000DCB5B0D|nr:protein-disulfide reductase DsbD domain-containing protein [Sinomicrobium sp. N-1-3-6]RAV29474.1 sugar transporter [Sinomicrobium sp. N-1-3-6]